MNVVAAMAGKAGGGRLRQVLTLFYMTGLAGQVCMRPFKTKIGSQSVIKLPKLPVIRVVTRPALRAKATLMAVILFVAVNTLPRGIIKPA